MASLLLFPSGTAREAVRQAARENDLDRYVAALLAPRSVRDDLVTLAAYLGTITRVPLTVAGETLGLIRLQWWRDAIERGSAGSLSGNPVADDLTGLMRRRELPGALLLAPLAAREQELAARPEMSAAAFTGYLDAAEGAGLRLAALILSVPQTAETERCLGLAGRAWAAIRLALDLPHLLAKGRCPVPATWHGGVPSNLAFGDDTHALVERVEPRLIGLATAAVAELRAMRPEAQRAVAPAILPVALVEPYLRALQRPGRDPLHPIPGILPVKRVARLWWAHVRRRV